MSKFKIGDLVYVHNSPELNNQQVTIVSGQIGKGDTAYRQIEAKNGKLHAIEIQLLTRTKPNKSTAKKKAAPAKAKPAASKPKAKAKAKPAAATKPKATAKGKEKVCVVLFNKTDTKEGWAWYREQIKKHPKATSEQRAIWKSKAMSNQYPGTRK